MSNYPWGSQTDSNPYDAANAYDYVGIQGIEDSFTNPDYPDRPRKADADAVVSTVDALYTELGALAAGDLLWIEAGTYDVTGRPKRRQPPANATIAGDGARIVAPGGINGFLELINDGIRITGLRFIGDQVSGAYTQQTIALLARSACRIDNCEFAGWQTSPIYVGWPTSTPEADVQPRVHHCVIRDNRTETFGYGILAASGDPLIEYSQINNNRYGISGLGGEASSVRVYNCLHNADSVASQIEQRTPGGKRMDVRYNELQVVTDAGGTPGRAYAQRDIPAVGANVYNNWIYNPTPPNTADSTDNTASIVQTGHGSTSFTNVSFGDNHFGSTVPGDTARGIQPLVYEATTSPWPGSNPPIGTEQGTDLTMPGDNGTRNVTSRQGIVIQPTVEIAGVRARLSSMVAGYTTAYLCRADGTILTSKSLSGKRNGDHVDLAAPLAAGTKYLITLDAGGATYTRGHHEIAAFPYSTTEFAIVSGVYSNGGTTSADRRYNFDAVQALLGESTVEPTPSEETATFTITAQDEHGRPIQDAMLRIYEDL